MVDLNALSPAALKAAMTGGTSGWGAWGSMNAHTLYVEPVGSKERRRCSCGCRKRNTHRLMANGIALASGCEMSMRRLARRPTPSP